MAHVHAAEVRLVALQAAGVLVATALEPPQCV